MYAAASEATTSPSSPEGRKIEHRGIREVVSDDRRVDVWEGRLDRVQRRIHDQRRERDDDPRPGPKRVVSDVEPERRFHRVALVLRGEHALSDVASATRLGARVPRAPPLDRNRDDEDRRRRPPVREIGQQRELVGDSGVTEQPDHTTHFRLSEGVPGGRDRTDHRHCEENQVRDDDPPQTGGRRVQRGHRAGDKHDLVLRRPKEDATDLDRGERHRRHNHAVEEDAQVQGPEAHEGTPRACRNSAARRSPRPSKCLSAATAWRRRRRCTFP